MDNDLKRLIEERIEDAINKGIDMKADSIAQFLGYGFTTSEYFDAKLSNRFEEKQFKIESGESWRNIVYDGNLVYESSDIEILSYVPGEWEKELEKLYTKSEEARQNKIIESVEKEKRERTQEEEALKRRFGLR